MDNKELQLTVKLQEAFAILREIYPSLNDSDYYEHMKETPNRIAKMWIDMLRGLSSDSDLMFKFNVFSGTFSQDWIIERNIEFSSICQHHMLPFSGTVDIGYIPNGVKVAGISKLARTVNLYSAMPNIQETFGDIILAQIVKNLDPMKCVVRVCAKHSCVACRGALARNSELVTFHTFGVSEDVEEFIRRLKT